MSLPTLLDQHQLQPQARGASTGMLAVAGFVLAQQGNSCLIHH